MFYKILLIASYIQKTNFNLWLNLGVNLPICEKVCKNLFSIYLKFFVKYSPTWMYSHFQNIKWGEEGNGMKLCTMQQQPIHISWRKIAFCKNKGTIRRKCNSLYSQDHRHGLGLLTCQTPWSCWFCGLSCTRKMASKPQTLFHFLALNPHFYYTFWLRVQTAKADNTEK